MEHREASVGYHYVFCGGRLEAFLADMIDRLVLRTKIRYQFNGSLIPRDKFAGPKFWKRVTQLIATTSYKTFLMYSSISMSF